MLAESRSAALTEVSSGVGACRLGQPGRQARDEASGMRWRRAWQRAPPARLTMRNPAMHMASYGGMTMELPCPRRRAGLRALARPRRAAAAPEVVALTVMRCHVRPISSVWLLSALLATPAFPSTGPELLERYRCNICHADREPKAGPAYVDIATHHRGDAHAVDKLMAVIRDGRHGGALWPMPPSPQVSRADARIMARYILSRPRAPGPAQRQPEPASPHAPPVSPRAGAARAVRSGEVS
jgi:cytochrome c